MVNNFNSNKGERLKMEESLLKHIISIIDEKLKNSMEFTKIWENATDQEKIQLMKKEENEVVSQVYQNYKDFLERHNTKNPHQPYCGMIAVFAENKNRGEIYFDKLLETFSYASIKKVVRNPSERRIELKNGYVYKIFTNSKTARGYRWVKAIIDSNLKDNADLMGDVKYGFLTDYDIEYFQ
jgi:hypothetical protein